MSDAPKSGPEAGQESPCFTTAVYDRSGGREEVVQPVARERPITLFLNERELVTLLCVGHHLDELAVGFLHGEGFLERRDDLASLRIDDESGRIDVVTRRDEKLASQLWMKRTITSGCGKGSLFYYALNALLAKPVPSTVRVSPAQVLERVDDLARASVTYRRTRGVHNTGLATAETMIAVRNDIGRHNAVDMVVGYCFLRDLPLGDKLLVTTGRVTSEVVIKAAKLGLQAVVSVHAATSLAVELSHSLNITLIGSARGGRFTVYAGDERIVA